MEVIVKDLYKSFNGNNVLKGLNIKIEKGKNTAIIGSSGMGKTVLLRHIAGLMKPDKGSIMIDGLEITNLSEKKLNEIRKEMGMVFQTGGLFGALNVEDNMMMALRESRQYSESQMKKVIKEKLALVGLAGTESLMPSQLSGGMKKRLAVARALTFNPQIILWDEPTMALDPILSDNVDDIIIQMKNEFQITQVVVTHDMICTEKTADYVGMIYDGIIIQFGTVQDLKNSNKEIVQKFISRR